MSEQTSGFLAKRLQQNWMNRYPDKPIQQPQVTDPDDSLTNLNWLQNINLSNFGTEAPLSPPPPHLAGSPLATSYHITQHSQLPSCTGVSPSFFGPYMNTNSSQIPQKVSTFGHGLRSRDDGMISSKSAIRSRILSSSSHARSNALHQGAHRYSGSSTIRSSNSFGSVHPMARSLLHSAHILRSSGLQMSYTPDFHQSNGTQVDYPVGVFKSAGLHPSTESISSYSMQTNGSNTSVIYPCPDQNFYSPELLLLRTNPAASRVSPATLRTYAPTIYSSPCSASPPLSSSSSPSSAIPSSPSFSTCSAILTRPETGFGFSLSLTELVDVSESGLFVTLDSLDQEQREAYRTNPSLCPPYSFHNLIYMSIQCMKRHKVTLNDISTWIRDNFAYFRDLHSKWEDLLRENLTTSRCFQRVPRRKEEPGGKGDLWRLNPEFQTQLENNKVSPKFLTAWQAAVDCFHLDHLHIRQRDVGLSSTTEIASENNTPTSSIVHENSPKTFRRYGSLDQLDDDESTKSHICFGKRKRVGSYQRRTLHSDGSSLNDTASSCASSSSPPLSDLYTPPPHLVPETDRCSTINTVHSSSGIDSTIRDESVPLPESNTPGMTEFYTREQTGPPQVLTYHGDTKLDSFPKELDDQSMDLGTDNDFYEMDTFLRTVMLDASSSRLTDDDTRAQTISADNHCMIDFNQGCNLSNQIIPLDTLPSGVSDHLDLTVRGIGLRPLNDWWSCNLSESITELFTDSLELPDHPDNLSSTPASGIPAATTERVSDQLASTVPEMESIRLASDTVPLTTMTQNTSAPGSPLSVGIEQHWIDEQLNLDELDSILGLT
ncbi:hypothetical protein D915_005599 [Fasciola hepatica]|uniref:Fork-head domain-containing protein n=1 Tax=Fasciola hepatica TaxID=6192 RepID=A0A4E0R5B2_FASHE|nr:hypothetical protein D915_005599 [Fasciola hepatica]